MANWVKPILLDHQRDYIVQILKEKYEVADGRDKGYLNYIIECLEEA